MKTTFITLVSLLASLVLSAEVYTWTGNGDGYSLFQEANWTLNGVSAPNSSINPNQALTFDLLLESGNIGGGGYSPDFYLGNQTLTITGGNLTGIVSKNAGITSGIDGETGNLIMNGGTYSCGFATYLNIELSNEANLVLYGTDPLNESNIILNSSYTGTISLQNSSISEIENDIIPNILIGDQAAVIDENIFIKAIDGNLKISLEPNTEVSTDVYEWTKGGDGVSLFQEANWTLNGEVAPDASINPNTALEFNLLVASGSAGGGGFSPDLYLGQQTLTITGGSVTAKKSNGTSIGSGDESLVGRLVMTGGKVSCGTANYLDIQLSGAANMVLYNDVPFTGSTIYMDETFTGSITLEATSYPDVESTILPLITIAGQAAMLDSNIYISNNEGYIVLSRDIRENIAKDWSDEPTGNKDYTDAPISNAGPNIIFILLDDLGYGDLGTLWQDQRSSSKKFDTPYIDKMAEEGCIMTNHYCAAPVCAPSRASLMEGLHQGNSSLRDNQFDSPIDDEATMAQLLANAGYRTMHIGKCGIGGGARQVDSLPAHPLRRGFDQFYGYMFHGQGHEHYPQNGSTGKGAYFFDGYRRVKVGTSLTYTTDVFTAKAKQWIETQQDERPEQPFFMYLAYDVPHFALQAATQAYPEGFGKDGGLQWTGFQNEDGSLVPTPWVNTAQGVRDSYIPEDYDIASWDSDEKRHVAMIDRVDHAVEDIIQLLKDYNIDDNTIIVFSSDNGGHNEGGHNPNSFESYADMAGGKRDLWEAGIRVPTIVRYPSSIPANTEVGFNSGFWDWLPTFADLADAPIPARTDGVSLVPALTGQGEQVDKGYTYVEYYHNGSTPNYSTNGTHAKATRMQMQMIRMGDFKGVRYDIQGHADNFEIYEIESDRNESTNLASQMPELQQLMKDQVLKIRRVDSTAARPYDGEFIPAETLSQYNTGLDYSYYEGSYNYVPDYKYMTPNDTGTVNNIDFSAKKVNAGFGFLFTGYIDIPTNGTYTFYMQTASKTYIKLHETHLLNDDWVFSGAEKSTSIKLEAGYHPIAIYYQQNVDVTPTLSIQLEGPDMPKATIPNSMLVRSNNTTPSAIKNPFTQSEMNIFPSMVTEEVNLFLPSQGNTNYSVSVYNNLGVVVSTTQYTTTNNSQFVNYNTSKLPQGMYIVKVRNTNNNEEFEGKFIRL